MLKGIDPQLGRVLVEGGEDGCTMQMYSTAINCTFIMAQMVNFMCILPQFLKKKYKHEQTEILKAEKIDAREKR